jgi:hypothetical protein
MGAPIRLGLTRELGTSCRRVIRPIGVEWPETLVFLADNTRIRFSKEPLQITPVRTSGRTTVDVEGKLVTDVRLDDAHTTDPSVEITCAERDAYDEGAKERARAKVDAWVGLLALLLGDGFAGEVLSEEYVLADASGEQAVVTLPAQFSPPPSLPSAELEPELTKNSERLATDARVELALRWYTRGLYSPDPLDAFVCYFFGLESLATSWFARLQPRPRRDEWTAAHAYFASARPAPSKRLKDRILEQLGRFTLQEQFERYWSEVVAEDIGRTFRDLNQARNDVAHGRRTQLTDEEMNACASLLRKALTKELDAKAAPDTTRRVHARFAAQLAMVRPPIKYHDPSSGGEAG